MILRVLPVAPQAQRVGLVSRGTREFEFLWVSIEGVRVTAADSAVTSATVSVVAKSLEDSTAVLAIVADSAGALATAAAAAVGDIAPAAAVVAGGAAGGDIATAAAEPSAVAASVYIAAAAAAASAAVAAAVSAAARVAECRPRSL